MKASTDMYMLIDDVSVVDTANPSVELLINPNFKNSSTTLPGWIVWCSDECDPGSGGAVINNSTCRSGNCYKSHCSGGGREYFVQTFPTVMGENYTVSFWYKRESDNLGDSVGLYIAII